MPRYSIQLFKPLASGPTPIMDITPIAVGWRRSININYGCKIGGFRIYPDKGYNATDLRQMFYELPGCHLEEICGGVLSWSGIIYSVDFCYKGDIRRRSIENMYNATRAQYISDLDVYAETAWYTDTRSIDWYGRKELIFQMNYFPQAAAESRAQYALKKQKDVYAQMVNIGAIQDIYIEIKVLGYAATGNWKYVTAQDDGLGNANVWISNILSTDCQFLLAGDIQTNTVQVRRTNKVIKRAFDTMLTIAEMGGPLYEPWQLYVDENRKLHYRPLSLTVKYHWRNQGLTFPNGEPVTPWTVLPAVVRDIDYPISKSEAGDPLLTDSRDTIIQEVDVASDGSLYLTNGDDDELAIISSQQEYEKMLIEEEEMRKKEEEKKRK